MADEALVTGERLISEILHREVNVGGQTLLSEIEGWDSLKGVKLMLRIEEELDRELTESELEGIRSVGDVDRVLAAH